MASKVRLFTVLSMVLSLLLLTGAFSNVSALPPEEADLIEGAKKEGKLVVYTSMNVNDATVLTQHFKKKYPFIKSELFRSKSEPLLNRISAEAKTGRYIPDVFTITGQVLHNLKKRGLLMKYISPEMKAYEKGFKDTDGYWTGLFVQINGMVYNKRLVSPEDAPRNYEDLLDPKWKGKKVGLDLKDYVWFATMLEMRGEEKGLAFMEKFAQQDLYLRENKLLLTLLLTAGEFSISANTYLNTVLKLLEQGAPIKFVPVEPVIATLHLAAVAAHSPHPSTAKLYLNFLLSKEGQKLIGSFRRTPCRPGIETAATRAIKGLKLYPSDPALGDKYSQITKQFREIFWKR
ncbi:ABC transporter substrate-binding protein [Thermodesulfobacteriota bacterium]